MMMQLTEAGHNEILLYVNLKSIEVVGQTYQNTATYLRTQWQGHLCGGYRRKHFGSHAVTRHPSGGV